MAKIPSYEVILGHQFENLVLNNRSKVFDLLEINPASVVIDNPYFQRATKAQLGCQVDYMIQLEHNILYLCEVKFSKKAVPARVINEVREKVRRLAIPKGMSVRPVLMHVNGISDAVKKSNYFTHIIDFSELLKP